MSSTAMVVSASYDKQIRVWDATSGRTTSSLTFQDSQVNCLLILPGTRHLAVAGFGVIRVYDMAQRLQGGTASNAATASAAPIVSGGNGGAGASAAKPPVQIASFESQLSMNFSSLGAFPLIRQGEAGGGAFHSLEDLSHSMTEGSISGDVIISGALMLTHSINLNAIGQVLYATSEDGHIRFFDANATTSLRVLKDIATGAAITCSALSPDRRYLITGNQIGQVAIWHLPSIVVSASLEIANSKLASNNTSANVTTATTDEHGNPMQHPPSDGHNPLQSGEANEEAADFASVERVQMEARLFGSQPLQEIAFSNDYTAVCSIAIEPLGRWVVVATNSGRLHFLRFANDGKLGGTRACADGAGSGSPLAVQSSPNVAHTSSVSGTTADGESFCASSHLPLNGRGAGGSAAGASPSDITGPRESVYRSALMVNELSNAVKRPMDVANSTMAGGTQSGYSTMGAALLSNLEQQRSEGKCSSMLTPANTPAKEGFTPDVVKGGDVQENAAEAVAGGGVGALSRPKIQEDLEMEVFYCLQAHYKYILKVAISPSCETLVTCSADYTVGRFSIPPVLRMAPPDAERTEASVTSTQAPPEPSRPSEGSAADPSTASLVELLSLKDEYCGGDADQQAKDFPTHTVDGMGGQPPETGGDRPFNTSTVAADGQHSSTSSEFHLRPLPSLVGHDRWVWDCVFSDCSNYLFTASSDSTIRMWSGLTADRPQCSMLSGHMKPVVSLLLHYDRR